jgi:hypothetical protein
MLMDQSILPDWDGAHLVAVEVPGAGCLEILEDALVEEARRVPVVLIHADGEPEVWAPEGWADTAPATILDTVM